MRQLGTRTVATRAAGLAIGALLLGGCSTFSADGGFKAVEQAVGAHLDQTVRWQRSDADRTASAKRVAELLAQPLGPDTAVQIALLNNRGLQASFAELGITEAETVQAGRLPNPGFRFARLKRGDEIERERSIGFDLARLIALPWLQQMETQRLRIVQGEVSLSVIALASDTRKAWTVAVAAQENLRYMQQVERTAAAGAELARRMEAVGNFSKLQRAREQAFESESLLNLARAEQLRMVTRERLTRLLGLWGAQIDFQLPDRLPDLPKSADDRPDIERQAMSQRLDVQGAKLAAAQVARSLGLTRTTRFINVLELGYENNLSNTEATQRGWEVQVELPLFDWGDARVAKAEALYMRAVEQAAQVAVSARSDVRETYGLYRSSYDIARHHRDALVPLRQLISEENVLRYNGMLIGVFELLADARLQIASVSASIDAVRDFWLASADLDMALIGRPGGQAALALAAGMEPAAAASMSAAEH